MSGRFSFRDVRLTIEAGLLMGLSVFAVVQGIGSQVPAPALVREAVASAPGSAAIRVIDGDTFDHGGERIRIADIDTPEVRGECAEERALAARATERLRVLLAAAPFALERLGRDEDRYGRKLRVVVRGGRSIGDQLVSEGLARTWTGRREPWC